MLNENKENFKSVNPQKCIQRGTTRCDLCKDKIQRLGKIDFGARLHTFKSWINQSLSTMLGKLLNSLCLSFLINRQALIIKCRHWGCFKN